MTRKCSTFFLLSFLFFTAEAYSFVSGALGLGYRGGLGEKIGSGTEIQASIHVDPIVFLPVSFGGSFTYVGLNGLASSSKVDLGEFALEVAAWLPFSIFSITPYVKGAVPVYNFFMGSGSKGLSGKAFSGFHGTVGLRWSFIPMFSLFFEGGAGLSQYEIKGEKAGGLYKILGGLQVSL